MYTRLDRVHRAVPVIIGIITLVGIGVLFTWDALPGYFPTRAHDVLAAFPLATIAFAYLFYQTAHRPPFRELVKAIMLAIAFLFWAANQLWPDLRQAILFNDIAIALFVLLPEDAATFAGALVKTGYMMQLIGATQLIVGLLLILNCFVPLALALFAPFIINSIVFHLRLEHSGLPMAAVFLFLELYLAWTYWDAYRPMLVMQPLRSRRTSVNSEVQCC